ncbi:serine/threonine-protein kinase h1 homolog [Plakobranchus ocellatus]|uniref:Serine/threonine-protein kinase h1 homolog n=1 Tax=Plakobranchus ocellatus TaxID=259542 RepID=A0AAV4BQD7_9GAST|nr:serine/threonine-protein kinase h1 homolog [Plakobranchus ocellatus]
MGCMSTKLVPEAPPNAHLVETVYRQDAKNRNSRHDADIKTQTHLRPRDPGSRQQPNSGPDGSNQGQGPRTNKKVKKYRDKFDPRVTAKYDIKALIGRGSFSRVVRVEHRASRQPYAIKMIDRIQGKEVFEAELNVLRRVKHMYIIQLVEVFEAPEKVYMVMELATGGELFDRIIAKGSFTERDATRVLIMVLEGVKYLHGLGITHRDLKPENLLYYHPGHDSKIMITDFGLSAMLKGPDNHMRTTCGTPEYIAPEILARKPYTCQVDLWAIGVITYILLSGTMPFDDDNRTRLYRMIIKAKYSYAGEHWKDVSPLAKDFIDKTLVLDPMERLGAVQASKHPWLLQSAAQASSRNLHRTISQNLLQRQSQRANSTKSSKSTRSNKSNRSGHSLRSDRRRVQPEEIDELHKDPEVQADLASLGSHHSSGRA